MPQLLQTIVTSDQISQTINESQNSSPQSILSGVIGFLKFMTLPIIESPQLRQWDSNNNYSVEHTSINELNHDVTVRIQQSKTDNERFDMAKEPGLQHNQVCSYILDDSESG